MRPIGDLINEHLITHVNRLILNRELTQQSRVMQFRFVLYRDKLAVFTTRKFSMGNCMSKQTSVEWEADEVASMIA